MGPGRGEIPCAPEVLWSQRVSAIPGVLWVREIPDGWIHGLDPSFPLCQLIMLLHKNFYLNAKLQLL